MKSFFKYSLLIIVLLLTSCGRVTEQEARKTLSEHLKTRYNEEFNIGLIGKRSDGKNVWYEADIYPKKYEETVKEYDRYYHSSGNVNIKRNLLGESIDYIGDIYSLVLLNESANEFYLPKLKELFGENVLAILDIEVGKLAIKPDFYTTLKNREKEGRVLKVKGGIYIFGRVESDEDREWYRKQIYEFVQFMKETGTFEYVDLDIIISDERALTKGYEEVTKKLVYNDKNMTEWKKRKNEEMKSLNSEFAKMTQKELNNKLNSINKSEYLQKSSGGLLYVKLYSPKYITSQNLDDEEVKNYDKLEDINFRWEVW